MPVRRLFEVDHFDVAVVGLEGRTDIFLQDRFDTAEFLHQAHRVEIPVPFGLFDLFADRLFFQLGLHFREQIDQVDILFLMPSGLDARFTESPRLGVVDDLLDGVELVETDHLFEGIEADPGAFADDEFGLEFAHVDPLVDRGRFFDDVVGHDRTVHLLPRDGRDVGIVAERFFNVDVGDFQRLVDRFVHAQLRHHVRAGDRRAAAEAFEPAFEDPVIGRVDHPVKPYRVAAALRPEIGDDEPFSRRIGLFLGNLPHVDGIIHPPLYFAGILFP